MEQLNFINTLVQFPGVCTYKNLPYHADLKNCDYAIAGIGFDTATTNRPGTRFAPGAIRNCNYFSLGYHPELDVDLRLAKGTDYGDISTQSGYTIPTFKKITEEMLELVKSGVIPIVMGGDHSITLPELRAYHEVYGPLALIHFDSHRDVRCIGEYYDHGTPFSRALEEGLIIADHSIQVGMRGGYHGRAYQEFGLQEGMKVISACEMHEIGVRETIEQIKEKIGSAPCFISFDIDFLDPACAPGTGTPVPGGFDTYTARTIIRDIGVSLDVKGFDLVEVLPVLDPSAKTAQAADGIIVDFIGTIARKKAERGQ